MFSKHMLSEVELAFNHIDSSRRTRIEQIEMTDVKREYMDIATALEQFHRDIVAELSKLAQ